MCGVLFRARLEPPGTKNLFHRETPKASNIRILKIPKDSKEVFQRIPKRCSKGFQRGVLKILQAGASSCCAQRLWFQIQQYDTICASLGLGPYSNWTEQVCQQVLHSPWVSLWMALLKWGRLLRQDQMFHVSSKFAPNNCGALGSAFEASWSSSMEQIH